MLYTHNHNNTIITTQWITDEWRLLYKLYNLSLYCKRSKRLFKVLWWEGVGDRTELQYFDSHSYGRQRCVFLVLLMLDRRPWGQLCWVLAFFTASYQQLLWTPTQSGAPSPFVLVWLSLPHLVYNSARTLTVTLSWLSYIIVQRPLSRLLDFWNRMFDCH